MGKSFKWVNYNNVYPSEDFQVSWILERGNMSEKYQITLTIEIYEDLEIG